MSRKEPTSFVGVHAETSSDRWRTHFICLTMAGSDPELSANTCSRSEQQFSTNVLQAPLKSFSLMREGIRMMIRLWSIVARLWTRRKLFRRSTCLTSTQIASIPRLGSHCSTKPTASQPATPAAVCSQLAHQLRRAVQTGMRLPTAKCSARPWHARKTRKAKTNLSLSTKAARSVSAISFKMNESKSSRGADIHFTRTVLRTGCRSALDALTATLRFLRKMQATQSLLVSERLRKCSFTLG